MIPIGDRPILWHLMHYYSQYGHKDFVLCLGYKANVIKEFFLNYRPQSYADCVVSQFGDRVEILGDPQQDWPVTMIDTGMWRNIGERLWAVREHLAGEGMLPQVLPPGEEVRRRVKHFMLARGSGSSHRSASVRQLASPFAPWPPRKTTAVATCAPTSFAAADTKPNLALVLAANDRHRAQASQRSSCKRGVAERKAGWTILGAPPIHGWAPTSKVLRVFVRSFPGAPAPKRA